MARPAIKSKPLWRVSVATTPEAEDAVAEKLGSLLERPASTYFNVESGTSTVTVYCEARPGVGIRKRIATGLEQVEECGLKIGNGKMAIARIRREDWAESWKRHFRPIEIGAALLVKPSWSKRRPRKNQALVVLDPGLSFGTGQHPTTAFCLHEIAAVLCGAGSARQQSGRSPDATKSFLDIGSGSGILAIAAAKLGCRPVHAFDFDANAVEIARVNTHRNGVSGKIRFWRGGVATLPMRPPRKYDLICANLISDLLLTERRRIAAQLNPSGTLVLAGILNSEFRKVQGAFEKLRFKLVFSKTEMEWRSGSFRRV